MNTTISITRMKMNTKEPINTKETSSTKKVRFNLLRNQYFPIPGRERIYHSSRDFPSLHQSKHQQTKRLSEKEEDSERSYSQEKGGYSQEKGDLENQICVIANKEEQVLIKQNGLFI